MLTTFLSTFNSLETLLLLIICCVLVIRGTLAILLAIRLQFIADARKANDDMFAFTFIMVLFFGALGAIITTLVTIALPPNKDVVVVAKQAKGVKACI